MAKLRIEIEKNEYDLYDFEVYENGEFAYGDENYTSEEAVLAEVRKR